MHCNSLDMPMGINRNSVTYIVQKVVYYLLSFLCDGCGCTASCFSRTSMQAMKLLYTNCVCIQQFCHVTIYTHIL